MSNQRKGKTSFLEKVLMVGAGVVGGLILGAAMSSSASEVKEGQKKTQTAKYNRDIEDYDDME